MGHNWGGKNPKGGQAQKDDLSCYGRKVMWESGSTRGTTGKGKKAGSTMTGDIIQWQTDNRTEKGQNVGN